MKHRNWLNITEYLLLIGSGVGSVASIVSQQLLFTAAPVSALFFLNLVNRRRGEENNREYTTASVAELDQKLSSDIISLQKQTQALPNFLDLAGLRKGLLGANQDALKALSRELDQVKQEMSKSDWRLMQRAIRQLQDQYSGLQDGLSNVTTQLNRLNGSNKVEGLEHAIALLKTELSQLRVNLDTLSNEQKLNNSRVLQDQISHLNRRLNQLPTPFDASSMKQDLNSLLKVVGDMASRRDLARVSSQMEKLAQQNLALEQSVTPLKIATAILKKQLEVIAARLPAVVDLDPTADAGLSPSQVRLLETLRTTVSGLEQRVSQLPAGSDLLSLRSEVQGMVSTHLGQLQQQLTQVQTVTHDLEQQQKSLHDWVNYLPQILDAAALQSQVKSLSTRLAWTETHDQDVQAQVEAAVQAQMQAVKQQLQAHPTTPKYELMFDVKVPSGQAPAAMSGCGSLAMVEQALAQATERLILVYPYPTPATLSAELIQQFKAFLERDGYLNIGWGHLGDVSNRHVPRSIERRRLIESNSQSFLYDTLNQLTQLRRQYPDRFRFKVLGTNENFLVCDRSFAILGAQSLALASEVFPQAAVGLRTTELDVIQELVARFDNPVLGATDADAYFNRALTRYDLGDRQGALADYTEVLSISPTDDVAYNNRALIYYDLGEQQQALTDFEQAVQHNPNNFIAYCNRGVLRAELGDRMGAIEDYTYTIQINPDYTTAYFHRGLARTRLQNRLGAIQDYTEVIRLHPQNATAYLYRGLACIKIGHRLDAIRDLQHAAELFTEQGDVANAQQALNALNQLHKTLLDAESAAEKAPDRAGQAVPEFE